MPFVAKRPHSTKAAQAGPVPLGDYFAGYLSTQGINKTQAVVQGVNVYNALGIKNSIDLYIEGLQPPVPVDQENVVNILCTDEDGAILKAFSPNNGDKVFTGFINLPRGTTAVYVQAHVDDKDDAVVYYTKRVLTPIRSVEVKSCDGVVMESIPPSAISLQYYEGYDWLIYDGRQSIITCPYGTYYLVITDAYNFTLFSEMFSYTKALPPVLLRWSDITDSPVNGQSYRNEVWLRTSVGRPEYEIEKEGDERDGYFFMEKGTSRKSYRMTFYAPEYLCDALRLVPLADSVEIYDYTRALVRYVVDDADLEVEWLEQGNYASVTLTFRTDTVVKNLGKITK